MCSKNDIDNIIKNIIKTAKKIYPSNKAILVLFGSYARDDFDADSDIDLMLIIDIPKEELSQYRDEFDKMASKLSLDYDITISIQLKDKYTFDKYLDVLPFYQNVWKEGVKYNVG